MNTQMDQIMPNVDLIRASLIHVHHVIAYQAYTAYSKEELNKNRIFTAKTGSLLYSGKI